MEKFLIDLSVILVGAAILSYVAVILKQPIIVAYIACGALLGPWGLGWVKNVEFIDAISLIGITLLLFLAGLCLHPQKLIALFKKTTLITLATSLFSFLIAFFAALLFRFVIFDSFCIGLALMFSSTILTVKLLPTTQLHQRKMGANCIGILIIQDLMAIAVLVFIRGLGTTEGNFISFIFLIFKLSLLIVTLFLFENYILRKILMKVERLHEALFIFGLAWCFGVASISNKMGLFYETGAFIAGVILARHPISLFISEKLKPLRDFFLVLFFFTLGAKLNFLVMQKIFIPAVIVAAIFVIIKPMMFNMAFIVSGEKGSFSKEIGTRLGQLSEFSLLIALLAFDLGHITNEAAQFIQMTTIFTFIASTYIIILHYPTPIGTLEELTQD